MKLWYYSEHYFVISNKEKHSGTYPNERILGVADSGEGAEVEDEGELGLLQGQGEGGKSRVLDAGAGAVGCWCPTTGCQCYCQAGQGTCHLAQYHFISCLQGWNVLQA